MRGALLLMFVLVALPILGVAAEPPPSYLVVATHPDWGTGAGHMWRESTRWVRMTLDNGWFSFTIYGTTETVADSFVLDQWSRPAEGPERFVATYAVDDQGIPTGVAAGGGKLNGFVITVYGRT